MITYTFRGVEVMLISVHLEDPNISDPTDFAPYAEIMLPDGTEISHYTSDLVPDPGRLLWDEDYRSTTE